MPHTGIFFIPSTAATAADPSLSPTHTIISRLNAQFSLEPLPPWSLTFRMFRETVPTYEAPETPKEQRSLKVLSLSYESDKSYILIQTRNGEEEVLTIPSDSTESFVQTLVVRFSPLWQVRQALAVTGGQAFDCGGGWRVRFGDVWKLQGGARVVRGTVCEIEFGENGEDADDGGKSKVTDFWGDLGVEGAREVAGPEMGIAGEGRARQLCEALVGKA